MSRAAAVLAAAAALASAGCAPLAAQLSALGFAQSLGEADLEGVRAHSTARLNRELWDDVDAALVNRLRRHKGMGTPPESNVRLLGTTVDGPCAEIGLSVEVGGAAPMVLRVGMAYEDGWRVDDIVVNPQAERLSLRALGGCIVAAVRFSEGLQNRDFDALRRASSADLRTRVVEEVAALDWRWPDGPARAAPDVAQQGFTGGEDAACFSWRVGNDVFTYRLVREDGRWRMDDVDGPGGSLKLTIVAALAAWRVVDAVAKGDREALREAVTPGFHERAISKLPEEAWSLARAAFEAGGGGPMRGFGAGASWPAVRESERGIEIAVDFGPHRLEAVVAGRRVDEVRFDGVSVAEHAEIFALLLAYAQAAGRGDREALARLSTGALAAAWTGMHPEGMALVSRLLGARRPASLEPAAGGDFRLDGDAAVLTAGAFEARLERVDGRWRVAGATVPLPGGAMELAELLPLADPLLVLFAGVESRRVALLREVSTPALNAMVWNLVEDEMLDRAGVREATPAAPAAFTYAVRVDGNAAEIRVEADGRSGRVRLLRDGRWRLDDAEWEGTSLRRAAGAAVAGWRFGQALQRGDLAALRAEASTRLREDVIDKVSVENRKAAVGGADGIDLDGARLGRLDFPESGPATAEILLSRDRRIVFHFALEKGRYHADDVVLHAGPDSLSLRRALKVGVAFGGR